LNAVTGWACRKSIARIRSVKRGLRGKLRHAHDTNVLNFEVHNSTIAVFEVSGPYLAPAGSPRSQPCARFLPNSEKAADSLMAFATFVHILTAIDGIKYH
jgi:hypothetical protein